MGCIDHPENWSIFLKYYSLNLTKNIELSNAAQLFHFFKNVYDSNIFNGLCRPWDIVHWSPSCSVEGHGCSLPPTACYEAAREGSRPMLALQASGRVSGLALLTVDTWASSFLSHYVGASPFSPPETKPWPHTHLRLPGGPGNKTAPGENV